MSKQSNHNWTYAGERVDWLARLKQKVVKFFNPRHMTREEFREWVKSNEDASKFFREIGENFGKVEFMDASKSE